MRNTCTHAPYDFCPDCARDFQHELQTLLGKAIDSIVLPGHAISTTDKDRMCFVPARHCEPYLTWARSREP